ncbi:HTH-type transcriptional regulator / antitoxin HigA [Chitinophaga sp. CF118]|uniref:helix-turn-helix domain-containing protein n=1 Tax=Chitinophaga sp. CF118 TaxID=1884367 RepID=UPI0008E01D4A|nr:helix-turn-helix domain-containing protein [Chitinophaga sp. CF118]SFE52491.1 HTH-type transcriptional regulator / antitoxin HigA [Chitinophaga sp. CF118]
MDGLKYKVIKGKNQYKAYCKKLEELTDTKPKNSIIKDEIELLTLLIETWDEEHNTLMDLDPIKLLQSLMQDHEMNATSLAEILSISKGYLSDILHYKKGLSKDVIRTLSAHFKVSQEAFNRPYDLLPPVKANPKKQPA